MNGPLRFCSPLDAGQAKAGPRPGRTTPGWTTKIAGLLSLLLLAGPALAGCSSSGLLDDSPAPNVQSAVQATVEADHAQATAASDREAWVRVGREFFLIDQTARDVADSLSTAGTGQMPADAQARLADTSSVSLRRIRDTITLLPVPRTAEGQAISAEFYSALTALFRLREDALQAPPNNSPASKDEFNNHWEQGRSALLAALRNRSITFSEVASIPTPSTQGAA